MAMVGIDTIESLPSGTTGTGSAIATHESRQVGWAIVGVGTVTGGVAKVEAALTQDFSGTWFELDSIDFSVSALTNAVYMGNYPNPIGGFVRIRISSAITGGGSIAGSVQKLVG